MAQLDEKMLLARLKDLEHGAEHGGKPCFSRFLDPREMALFKRAMHPRQPFMLWGGYPDSERQMLGFFPDYMEPVEDVFPIRALRLSAGEKLEHRTVLGSLMGLGIERNLIGDVAMEEEGAVIFVCESIADFLLLNLTKAGRMRLHVSEAAADSLAILPRQFKIISGTVASLRLDCVLGLLTGMSRSATEELLKKEMVCVNHSICSRGAALVSAGDVLSVRRFGRAEVAEIFGETKKGRIRINLKKYI
ncbi:MAG: RNA-binding protein [Ruminococcaceae bacterium]|nr:RNA-binding protein [Oscillospiraceae bacterium]